MYVERTETMALHYDERYNPYEKKPALGYNIAEMSRYARKNNRKISELTKEEAAMFAVK